MFDSRSRQGLCGAVLCLAVLALDHGGVIALDGVTRATLSALLVGAVGWMVDGLQRRTDPRRRATRDDATEGRR